MSDLLATSLRRLVRKACDGLERAEEKDVPTQEGLIVQPKGKRRRIVNGEIPSWGSAPELLPQDYLSREVFEASRSALGDERVRVFERRMVWAFNIGIGHTAADIPAMFLSDYFDTGRSFRYDDEHFRKRYSEMLRFHDPDAAFRLKIVVPLWGFDAVPRRMTIGDYRIRKVTSDEIARIANESFNIEHRFDDPYLFSHILEFAFDTPKVVTEVNGHDWQAFIKSSDSIFEIAARVNQEIVLLRCFTDQVPRAVTFGHIYDGWPTSFFRGGLLVEPPWRNSMSASTQKLTLSQVGSLRRLREKFLRVDSDLSPPLQAAARRIALAEDAPYAGDQLVDFVTAIEGLLLDDGAAEAKYRFKERVAFLLGARPKRVELAKTAATIYDLRSQVVHGQVVPDEFGFGVVFFGSTGKRKKQRSGSVQKAAQDARQMAKDSLRKITLMGGHTPDWDRKILG